MTHIRALTVIKRVQDLTDADAEAFWPIWVDAVSDLSEVAVIIALHDLRIHDPSPWFPMPAAVRDYAMPLHTMWTQMAEAFL